MPGEALEIPASGYDAVIFDCDGTLVDSMPMHYDAWEYALAKSGFAHPFTHQRHYGNAGMPIPATVAQLNAEFGTNLDADRINADRAVYLRKHHPTAGPVLPVVDFAGSLAGKLPMAVASGSDREIVDDSLAHLGIAHLFPVVVTPEDVAPGRGKPAPDMFLLAAERMDVDPARCLVFEDGHNGILAAQAAGMQTVFVPTPAPT
ncbi:HAD-IA family hydrolase [soil metagenome]